MREIVARELEESASVTRSVSPEQVLRVASILVDAFRRKNKVLLFGNGGSAADAQHIAAELSGRYLFDRPPLEAAALTNVSAITAIGNDYSYESVFERQVEASARPGDVVIGISTSGNSANVLRAVAKAKALGATTVGFSGPGGKLMDIVDEAVTIPSTRTSRIQEGYMAAAHVICGIVERSLFGGRAVFIDRDGTIARDVPYCPRPEDLVLFDGVGEAVRKLNEAGFLVIVVTNQSGVGRGYFNEQTLGRIHQKMVDDLAEGGGKVDAVFYCPHRPEDGCRCRKPELGMVLQALERFPIDLASSYVVGDSDHDMELARRIGAQGISVNEEMPFPQAVKLILERVDADR